jgi:hypothetical protein
MRKMLVLLGALVLCATPAAAQTSGPAAPAETPAAEVERAQTTTAPSLFPTTDEVREQVRAVEEGRESRSRDMSQRDFLYLVAAIAVGVIIAAVVLD